MRLLLRPARARTNSKSRFMHVIQAQNSNSRGAETMWRCASTNRGAVWRYGSANGTCIGLRSEVLSHSQWQHWQRQFAI